jgi:hypothetical protein
MIRKCFTLKTSDISLVQFIIEGYEGLATVSTIDSKAAVIQVLIMPDFVLEMESLLQDLQILFPMEEISSGSDRVE